MWGTQGMWRIRVGMQEMQGLREGMWGIWRGNAENWGRNARNQG